MTLTLDALNVALAEDGRAALDGIFENAPWLGAATLAARPFAKIVDVHTAAMAALRAAEPARVLEFLRGHPELGGKVARAGLMSPASIGEQAGLGLDRLDDAAFARFERLNAAYVGRFGFPFIICVRRYTLDALLDNFERRCGNDREIEIATALNEISEIISLRLHERIVTL